MALGTSIWLANDAYATCINTMQAQTIAAAYNGDETPTVHHMDTCSGDDIGYQIPIATNIVFDGVTYENVYATTNSVITFGQPDGTYWDYPQTPSISLYSMDWFPGYGGNTEGLDIYYSEGGFQINLNMVPFGNWNAEPSTVNILVAITNTGGIAVSYSYQGPEYPNLRTGVRLHDGSIVSLEAWGATQIQAGEEIPTLEPEPIPEPSPTPTGPTQEELEEEARVQEEVRVINNLLAAAAGMAELTVVPPVEEPIEELPSVEEEVIPEPDVEIEPEIITPEDPRFPEEPTTEPTSEPTVEPSPTPESSPSEDEASPLPEPSPEPTPTPDQTETTKPDQTPKPTPSEDTIDNDTVEETVTDNDTTEGSANLLADLTNKDTLSNLTPEQKEAVSKTLGIKTEDLVSVIELAKSDPVVAEALESFAEKAAENINAPMPYTLADAIVEERMEELLSNPVAVLGSMLDINLGEIFGNLSSLGSDMTDDQREKAQEVVVPVIIASNIVAAAMTRRK